MKTGRTFAAILKRDGKLRLLFGGVLLDGALVLSMIVAVGLALF